MPPAKGLLLRARSNHSANCWWTDKSNRFYDRECSGVYSSWILPVNSVPGRLLRPKVNWTYNTERNNKVFQGNMLTPTKARERLSPSHPPPPACCRTFDHTVNPEILSCKNLFLIWYGSACVPRAFVYYNQVLVVWFSHILGPDTDRKWT